MHCLDHIRASLVNGDDGSDHTVHCFHYLWQGILCAADTTPEPGGVGMRMANGDIGAAGDRTVHTCRTGDRCMIGCKAGMRVDVGDA